MKQTQFGGQNLILPSIFRVQREHWEHQSSSHEYFFTVGGLEMKGGTS